MSTVTQTETPRQRIDRLEAEYAVARRDYDAAYRELEHVSEETRQREQAAYDALVDAKDELDECHDPGCRVIDEQYAFCPEHRP